MRQASASVSGRTARPSARVIPPSKFPRVGADPNPSVTTCPMIPGAEISCLLPGEHSDSVTPEEHHTMSGPRTPPAAALQCKLRASTARPSTGTNMISFISLLVLAPLVRPEPAALPPVPEDLPQIVWNDNDRPAGRLDRGTLTLDLEVRRGLWHILGPISRACPCWRSPRWGAPR